MASFQLLAERCFLPGGLVSGWGRRGTHSCLVSFQHGPLAGWPALQSALWVGAESACAWLEH